MAKKKFKFHKKYIWIPGAAIAGILVAVFVFGFGLDFVNPLFQEPQGLTANEIQQNEKAIIDINKALEDEFGDGDPNSICIDDPTQEITCDEIIDPIDPPPINEIVMNGTQGIIEDPPITNGTQSDDPPIDQICDELDLGCGTRTLTLTSIVTKTDSSGITTVVEETFDVGQLAFFVEDISGIDFATGRISIELIVEGEIGQDILGSGEMDVLIRGESVLPNPVIITPVLISDGIVQLRFGSALSDNFLVSIADHFDKFLNEQVSRLSFVTTFRIDEAVIQEVICDPSGCSTFEGDAGDSFGVTNLKVFSMDIARDDQRIIVVNEQGIEERIFPSDSRLVISSVAKSYTGEYCLVYACTRACGSCPQTCTGSPSITASCIGSTSNTAVAPAGTAPAPTLTSINIIDIDGILVTTSAGGSGSSFFDYNQLTRNANYTMTVGSPVFSSVLNYGKTQETQSYTCFSDATVNFQLISYGVYPWISTGAYKGPSGITIGATQCNFP